MKLESQSQREIEFWVAYDRCRFKGDAASGNTADGVEKSVGSSSPTKFQAYRPPVIERHLISEVA